MMCEGSDCCEQALSFWGVLEELDVGKTVPNLKGLGFSMLGSNDSLVFTSNAWNITLDSESGMMTAIVMPTPFTAVVHVGTVLKCCLVCKCL